MNSFDQPAQAGRTREASVRETESTEESMRNWANLAVTKFNEGIWVIRKASGHSRGSPWNRMPLSVRQEE